MRITLPHLWRAICWQHPGRPVCIAWAAGLYGASARLIDPANDDDPFINRVR